MIEDLEADEDLQEFPQLAPCGYGFQGHCCCECALRLIARPRCTCLGGKRACGRHLRTPLQKLAAAAEPPSYVCMAFAHEGVAQTDWTEHGYCEAFRPRALPVVSPST